MARRSSLTRGSRRGAALAGLAGALLVAAATGCGPAAAPPEGREKPPAAAPTFVGRAACEPCHEPAAAAWRRSDHAHAMAKAGAGSVLGNFRDARFTGSGGTTTFLERDGKFLIRTAGPDGKRAEFPVAYTFGVRPLQQYLIPLSRGRLQAFGIAWDARPAAAGGQRWFDLHPGERFSPGDPLHWTGREQTWNYQCAECHSTDLRKNYDLARDAYDTRWAEIDVSCEACHGPGSDHVAWAKARRERAPVAPGDPEGLVTRLARPAGAWVLRDAERGIAAWSGAPRTRAELDVCARCHARRRPIVDPYPYGRPFLDTHAPAPLEPGLYHADGQILGEVYVYGSFIQSRMFGAGVTCSDCHEPHALSVRAPGNALCGRCHVPAKFDVPAHHHHAQGSEAARCVSCHMTTRTYMVVDPRRDHSFRVPRPDLSAAIGTPNACNGCHADHDAAWAAEKVVAWYGAASAARRPSFAEAIDAGRRGRASAERDLAALAADPDQPGIARAAALSLLPQYLSPASLPAIRTAIGDEDAIVRAAAVSAAEAIPMAQRVPLAAPSLRDPVRLVRISAARALAGAPPQSLGKSAAADLDRALGELVASETASAERPESHLNLSLVYARMGRPGEAEAELRTALRLDPRFVPAMVNLADLFREQGRDDEGERWLEEAIRVEPESPEALHALGLLRARQGKPREAVGLLRRSAALRPEDSRFAYVYAVALASTGDRAGAIRVLKKAHRRRPADRQVLAALVSYEVDAGARADALKHAERLLALSPDDARVRGLVESLRREAGAR